MSNWLSVVKYCNINSSTKDISDSLSDIELQPNDELIIIRFDIKPLYTNVPLDEAIHDCTELLFSGQYPKPPVDKEALKTPFSLCSRDFVLLSNDSYYKQILGLAMGEPSRPTIGKRFALANLIKLSRATSNCLPDTKNDKLDEINNIHPILQFTIERENNMSSSFLDIC